MTESFANWLFTQTDSGDERGALARAAKADPLFPAHGDKSIYDGYYETADDPETRDVFQRAWNEFEGLPS